MTRDLRHTGWMLEAGVPFSVVGVPARLLELFSQTSYQTDSRKPRTHSANCRLLNLQPSRIDKHERNSACLFCLAYLPHM